MSGEPDNTNPHASRMNEVFDFESRPGLALVRPEIAKRLSESCKPPEGPIINYGVSPGVASVRSDIADALAKAAAYHPDDEEEDGVFGRTWYLEWDMWVFILLCLLSLAGVWQVTGWACDLWQYVKGGVL